MHTSISLTEKEIGDSPLEKHAFDWPRMKRGFIANDTARGSSRYELNRMARLACLGNDRPVAVRLFGRIRTRWDPTALKRETFDRYRAWAMGPSN